MKKILILVLIGWVLIGRLPAKEWEKVRDKASFLYGIAFIFANAAQCPSQIMAIEEGEYVFFFGGCKEKGEDNGRDKEIPPPPKQRRAG